MVNKDSHYHSQHPLLHHSFTVGWKPPFYTNPSHFLLPGLQTAFTDHWIGLELPCSSVYFYFIFSLIILLW